MDATTLSRRNQVREEVNLIGIVKSFMKNRSGTYGKTRETLPLEGGGKREGVRKA